MFLFYYAKRFREADMRKAVVRILHVFICLLLSVSIASYAQPDGKAGVSGQKKGSNSKIVIEYVSFPEALKKYEVYPWETIAVEEFKKAYRDMLASKDHDEWVRMLTGTGNKNRMLHFEKEHLLLIAICKPHFCDTHQMVLLFNPAARKCYAIQAADGKFTYLGAPDEKMINLLKILLVDEYKDIYKGQ